MNEEITKGAIIAKEALEDKKAEDIKVLDLKGMSNIADCFVIASGNNINQIRAMADEVDGTVTNALNKEAINLAGHHYSGHTEIYAHYTGTKKYTMMLAHHDLRVVHVSTHVSLREACDRVKKASVLLLKLYPNNWPI